MLIPRPVTFKEQKLKTFIFFLFISNFSNEKNNNSEIVFTHDGGGLLGVYKY